MSDTANVMKGKRSGVQKLIKDENPSLYDIGCICHLADLCIKAGMSTLPLDIDQLFIDIYYYFHHSSKRNQEFVDMWRSFYTDEPKVILKHCQTRWLSLLRCVDRYLDQLPGLISYFLSCEQTAKVVGITDRLKNPLTKPLLLFLKHVLPFMDKFNRSFQKSNENTTCELFSEINRLVRLYAVNVLTENSVREVGDKIHTIDLEKSENYKPDENMSLGTDTWACVAELEEEMDMKPFFSAVRKFYLATLKKMFKKFPFGDTLLKDLGIVQPNKTDSYTVKTVHRLAKKFPQIELASSDSLEHLAEEFTDFLLSPMDLPPLRYYKDCNGEEKPRPGPFWWEVGKMKTLLGEYRFPNLAKLMAGLLSIPCSNADSERGFSILRKLHTDQRHNLDQSTLISLMSVKFNSDACCHEVKFDNELLTDCKKATHKALTADSHSSTST